MKRFLQLCAAFAVLISGATSPGQSFVNLDFEQAALFIPPTPVGTAGSNVDPLLAFPGWTVQFRNQYHDFYYVLYNNVTVSSPSVNLIGPSFPNRLGLTPLQGSYSAYLHDGIINAGLGIPTLSQTGTVPAVARSLTFLGVFNDSRVAVNGTTLPLFSLPSGRWAVDMTAFAGQSVELSFETLPRPDGQFRNFFLDDIQFSTSPAVPEPATFALASMTIAAFLLIAKRRSTK